MIQPLGIVYIVQEPEPSHIDTLARPVTSFRWPKRIEFNIYIYIYIAASQATTTEHDIDY